MKAISDLGWEQLLHPSCSPDQVFFYPACIGPKNFASLKFSSDDQVKNTLKKKPAKNSIHTFLYFFTRGIQKLFDRKICFKDDHIEK